MAHQIIIPQTGTSVDRVTIISWKAREGDLVRKGDLLCEVETDKSALEIESFYEGTVIKILAEEGDEVGIGEIIAYLGTPGEEVPEEISETGNDTSDEGAVITAVSSARNEAAGTTIKAMPKVRKLARTLGVELTTMKPVGKSGLISEADVRRASAKKSKLEHIGIEPLIELSKNQKAVAARIRQSYNEIIPINLYATINVSSLMIARRQSNREQDRKLSFDAFFACAAADAMRKYPRFQYYYQNDRLIHAGGANIGIAVSTEEELFIPVIKDADSKINSTAKIDARIMEFKKKVRSKRFLQDDLEGGVFLLSNLGMYPVDIFTVIIPPGYSAALSVGRTRISREPITHQSAATVDEQIVTVMLSVDHRMINGRLAARFLQEIKERIESR